MGISYFIFSIFDIVILFGGRQLLSTNQEQFICLNQWYLASTSNEGTGLIFAESLMFYMFSISSWYTYYYLPDKHGLIGNIRVKDLRMTSRSSKGNSSNLDQSMEQLVK